MKKHLIGERIVGFALIFAILFRMWMSPAFGASDSQVGENDSFADVNEVIREGFYGFRESIDISGYNVSPDRLGEIFSFILKDDPYLFFVDRNLSYSYVPGGNVICIKPRYIFLGSEAFEAWSLCRDFVRDAARLAVEKESELERVLFVHDYICENFSYDEDFQNDDLYKMIVNRSGTCQGYTDLYTAILRECGIESHFVASDRVAHIWNYVKVDGEWYHSDTTWDDLAEGYRHRHFLLSDAAAIERGHIDWYSPLDAVCGSEIFDRSDEDQTLLCPYQGGDVDHSGETDLTDVICLRVMLEESEMSNCCEKCSDLNGDVLVDGEDLRLIREKIMKNFAAD